MPSLTLILSSLLVPSLVATRPVPTPPSLPAAPVLTQGAVTAITNARIEIGDGRVIENGTLVFRGDRIVYVGPTQGAVAATTSMDAKGLTIYPGFIDAYSSVGLTLPAPTPNVGPEPDTNTTAPATMWSGNRKGIRADVRAAASLNPKASFASSTAQGITTVLLSSGTGSIAGSAALVDLTAVPNVLAPDVAHEFVLRGAGRFGGVHDDDLAGAQGAPTVQGQPGPPPNQVPPGGGPQTPPRPGGQGQTAPQGYPYPGTLFGITALVRQTLWDARAYAGQKEPQKDAKKDPTYEGLRPLLSGRVPALFTLATSREITRAARIADEFGFRFVVNGVPDAYRQLDLLKARRTPVIVSLDLGDEPPGRDTLPARVYEDRLAQYKERNTNARLLDAAGIPIAFRTGPDPYLVGVRKLVTASGLPRDAALRAMTVNPARIFGVVGQVGTLEVGKRANLVLMTGDFLDADSEIQTVFVGGVATTPAKKEATK